MYNIVLGLHVFVCVLLIVSVLIQSGKGGGLGSTFGGGSSNNMFGPGAPANFMQKATTIIAACFLLLSLVLALMASNRNADSLLREYQPQSIPAQQQPVATPAPEEPAAE
jgi:preprotein translocase subunit SecG